MIYPNMTTAWFACLERIINHGDAISPRGQPTLEVVANTLSVRMVNPVLVCPARKLSYRFMAAEAYWILTGDDSVGGIAPYNKNISQFSDDGVSFYGAYGPRIDMQLDHVVDSLLSDPATRQAVLTIWRQNPEPSKDIPCTVAMAFFIRGGELHLDVYMRSSDVWLGLPYDIFNFTTVAMKVAALYNEEARKPVSLGTLHWKGVSSHLYRRNLEDAKQCLRDGGRPGTPMPSSYHQAPTWNGYLSLLQDLQLTRGDDVGGSLTWGIRP